MVKTPLDFFAMQQQQLKQEQQIQSHPQQPTSSTKSISPKKIMFRKENANLSSFYQGYFNQLVFKCPLSDYTKNHQLFVIIRLI